jgi:riboflavin biosynthesis pyrimidine reductase
VDLRSAYDPLDLDDAAPPDRPYVIANMVSSVDGEATLDGRSSGISSDADRELFHVLRTQVDAVMAGTNTIERERYGPLVRDSARRQRRAELGLEPVPLLITASRTMDLPADSRIAVITSSDRDPPDCSAQLTVIRTAGETIDFSSAFATLRSDYDVTSALLEGGPTLLGTLIGLGLVDELFLTLSPVIAGGGSGPTTVEGAPLPEPVRVELESLLELDSNLFFRYRLVRGTA